MRIPLSWLREYVAVEASAYEIARRLSISALEVERVIPLGIRDANGNLGYFRVGKVLEAGKHPNADRLQLCQVDVGENEPRQIVCGAWNFAAGATVAVALPGAVMPEGFTIEQRTLRDAVSDGMILSERELELGSDHTRIIVLPDGPEPGTPLAEILAISDEVLEVIPTMNRGDLLSVYGVAREVAALADGELEPMPGRDPERAGSELVDVQIEDLEGCPRYIGRVFGRAAIAPSPLWLRARLAAAGLRPISNVVDVTNYVMHALGSPLHVFDRLRLAEGRIVVRRAVPGETLQTLDGDLRRLDPSDLVIADAERPVAIAGVMGGLDSEVGEDTTEVLLEAANFEPVTILRTSERLGLRSDASNRWEKGVDPQLAERAAALASQLIVELAGARLLGSNDVSAPLPERPVVRLRPGRADAIIGVLTPPDEQRAILERLGFEVGDDWQVTVPTWRARDVTREVDLVEEVARVLLERLPYTMPLRRYVRGRLTKEQRLRRLVEDVLVGAGFDEAYTWSLVPEDCHSGAIRLANPMTSDQAILRTNLLYGLVEAAQTSVDAGDERIALFEIARVYLPTAEQLPEERWRVGGIVTGGYFRAKGTVETVHAALKLEPAFERAHEPFLHPGRAARVDAGWVGELHPTLLEGSWGIFELDLDTLFAGVPERILYEDVITYPAVLQDLAFVVDEELPAGELVQGIKDRGGSELREARVFDVYRGGQIPAGKKSIAVRVEFQSPERTLSDEDAQVIRARIVAALADAYGAELRA